ncbi:MAG: hypothetical protein DRJ03_07210 [Chloroflexi bacterium]|nr:MAG: hypothetical protein DRJ03_07210 [Chloroflexota bacterium]
MKFGLARAYRNANKRARQYARAFFRHIKRSKRINALKVLLSLIRIEDSDLRESIFWWAYDRGLTEIPKEKPRQTTTAE